MPTTFPPPVESDREAVEIEADFAEPRTMARMAEEQRAFLATIPPGFFVDVDLPEDS